MIQPTTIAIANYKNSNSQHHNTQMHSCTNLSMTYSLSIPIEGLTLKVLKQRFPWEIV